MIAAKPATTTILNMVHFPRRDFSDVTASVSIEFLPTSVKRQTGNTLMAQCVTGWSERRNPILQRSRNLSNCVRLLE